MPRTRKVTATTKTKDQRALRELSMRAVSSATSGQSTMNYRAIIDGFTAKGVCIDDIKPRVNVFTFHAWCALGRCVKKGEHGVQITTFVPMERVDDETGEVVASSRPRQTTVFHESQTQALRVAETACAVNR